MEDKIRILIVDDDQTVLVLLEEVLSSDESLDIDTLSDSAEAYERLKTERYDLLITDLMMPGVDGLRLLEHAVALNPSCLVVIVTGYASLETTLEAIHAGVYDYITKPFRIEEFRLLVNNAVARIRLMNENKHLTGEKEAVTRRIANLESTVRKQAQEIERLKGELARRRDMMVQSPTRPKGEQTSQASGLVSYERGLETPHERLDRRLRDLEEQFSSGQLTSEEYEVAKQRLKTRI